MLKSLLHRLGFIIEAQDQLEVLNHSAAASFAFLLSAVPALLVSIVLGNQLFPQFVNASTGSLARDWLSQLLNGLVNFYEPSGPLTQSIFSWLGLVAIVGLYFSAMLFVSTIRKGLRLILGGRAQAMTLQQALWAFFKDLLTLAIIITVLVVSQFNIWSQGDSRTGLFLLYLVLAGFCFFTLYFLAPQKPPVLHVLLLTLGIVGSFALLAYLMQLALNVNQYQDMYGLLARLIIILLHVYVFFNLYFYAAVIYFVERNFDALLFGRHQRVRNQPTADAYDKWLFDNIPQLDKNYRRTFAPDQFIFHKGEESQKAYFIQSGSVAIIDEQNPHQTLGVLQAGEIFGETAYFLQERRTASAKAVGQVQVLELPPQVFSHYLQNDGQANSQLIATLIARLKKANNRA